MVYRAGLYTDKLYCLLPAACLLPQELDDDGKVAAKEPAGAVTGLRRDMPPAFLEFSDEFRLDYWGNVVS